MLSFTALATDLPEADAYAVARGWADWTGVDAVKLAALRRGQDAIAAAYNGRWADDDWDDADAPEVVRFAIIEAARRELAEPGSMAPDLERGGAIKRLQAGSVQIEYADGASSGTTFTAIDNLLSSVLAASSGASVDLLRV